MADAPGLVAGDPFEVSAVATSLTSIARDVAVQAQRLRLLSEGSWIGNASAAAHARIATLPPMLDKAHESYAEAGSALASYARSLDAAQQSSVIAVALATRATADLDATRFSEGDLDAGSRLKRALAMNAEAHDDQQAAARILVSALRRASHAGIRNSSWLHHVGHAIGSWTSTTWVATLKAASRVGQAVAVAAGVAALVLALGGAFFPPLEVVAAGLEVASLTGATVAGVADVGLAASGHGSWTAVGADALALAPAGAGRLVSKAAPALHEGRFLKPATVVHASTGSPAGSPWRSWGNPQTLIDHVDRHAADFGYSTPREYVDGASAFLQRGLTDRLPIKFEPGPNIIRVYEPSTNTFGSFSMDETTRTFFKPKVQTHPYRSNWDYWLKQPGEDLWDGRF